MALIGVVRFFLLLFMIMFGLGALMALIAVAARPASATFVFLVYAALSVSCGVLFNRSLRVVR